MKLEITKGREWNADFTVVSSDGITPEVLDPGDTGTFSISTVGKNPTIVVQDINLNIQDADNGLFNVVLTANQTSLLEAKIGFGEDKYPTISNYTGTLDLILVAGNRQASVPLYIRDIGIV